MKSDLQVEICPETGICSVLRADRTKVDLMPDEVDAITAAAGRVDAIRAVVSASDEAFAARLTPAELAQIAKQLS